MAVVEGSEALVIAGLGRAREYGVEPSACRAARRRAVSPVPVHPKRRDRQLSRLTGPDSELALTTDTAGC
jgi:hypothetical protein